jgi:hypothetical protein
MDWASKLVCKPQEDFSSRPRVSFSPPKNPILLLIFIPKSSVFIYQIFFKGISGNSGGEKEKQGMEREILNI